MQVFSFLSFPIVLSGRVSLPTQKKLIIYSQLKFILKLLNDLIRC
jgi:hypothetical protein